MTGVSVSTGSPIIPSCRLICCFCQRHFAFLTPAPQITLKWWSGLLKHNSNIMSLSQKMNKWKNKTKNLLISFILRLWSFSRQECFLSDFPELTGLFVEKCFTFHLRADQFMTAAVTVQTRPPSSVMKTTKEPSCKRVFLFFAAEEFISMARL